MSLTRQKEILINIYSIDYLLKCSVFEVSDSIVKLSPVSGKTDMFQINDPVVLIYHAGQNNLETAPADAAEIDRTNSMVAFSLRKKQVEEERRIFERYPVSLEVSVRRKFSSKRLHFIVKDVSLYGMGAVSQADLDEEELIDIDLITDRSMFYFSGMIKWKNKLSNCFEYGIQLTTYDIATKYAYEEFLGRQKEGYINMIAKAR